MALLIGPSGSGKTSLVKRLQTLKGNNQLMSFDQLPQPIPTIGINLGNISVSRRHDITMREIGGTMAPIWKDYYRDSKICVFVIDSSNFVQVSPATIQLLNMLNHVDMAKKPVLILFNKADISTKMTKSQLYSIIPFNDILNHASQDITIITISVLTGEGISDVMKWLQKHS